MEELGKSASNELGSAKETTFPDFFDSLEETNGLDGISEKDMPSRKESNFPDFFDQNRNVSDQNEGESSEVNSRDSELYSTYDERIKQTPKEGTDRGEWDGPRGESTFYPPDDSSASEILSKYSMDGIAYEDGIPDFSECSESTVKIDGMTENRAENFKQCDAKCAEQWNKEKRDGRTDWTPNDVKEWRRENGYSWHERNDMETCDLVPTEVNDYFGHLGGVSECKKRDADSDGGDFDD